MEHDKVFDALAHESRRKLLDALFERDGQTLSELCALLPVTRFGCMKHLEVLEGAGLIVTKKQGREKLHYLNPIPIQQVYDRWVSKYAQPFARRMTGLKVALETETMSGKTQHIYEILIRTTPERLWNALTDGEVTQQYYYHSRAEGTWEPGSDYRYVNQDGGLDISGKVLESTPPTHLAMTFKPHWNGDDAPVTRVTWDIEPMGAICKLRVTHDALEVGSPMVEEFKNGWTLILSGLKTLLETGEPMMVGSPAS